MHILIPFRYGATDRWNDLVLAIKYYKHIGYQVIVVEQDITSQFKDRWCSDITVEHILTRDEHDYNRARGINVGILSTSYPSYCIVDGDILIPQEALHAAEKALDTLDAVTPYSRFLCLGNKQTMCLQSDGVEEAVNWIKRKPTGLMTRTGTNAVSGALCINRGAFVDVGGFEEYLYGWGGEDNIFEVKINAFLKHATIEGPMYHMYHKPAKVDRLHYQATVAVMRIIQGFGKEHLREYCEKMKQSISIHHKLDLTEVVKWKELQKKHH